MWEKKPAQILQKLQDSGFEAWYVGGCVRDTLLDRPVHDWDITTSARPEQIMACFSHCVPTGIRHGTVTVLEDGTQAEVTTYRTDGDYTDGRHPENVMFVSSLEEDLARRDFTVNAMAMNDAGEIVDPFGGQEDLKRKLLRCVGEPERRFREDALRILRAIRFSAQLGFQIDGETEAGMGRLGYLCAGLSAERIRDELEKIIMSARAEMVVMLERIGIPEEMGLSGGGDCTWISSLPEDRLIRWAALCRSYPSLDLTALRLDRQTARDAMTAGRLPSPESRLDWKHLIAEQGKDRARILGVLMGETERVEEILHSGECLSLKELAVTGANFPELRGKEVGKCLHFLLCHVLECPQDNKLEVLKNFYKNQYNSIDSYF